MSKTTQLLIAVLAILGGIYLVERLTSKTSTTETVSPFAGLDTSSINRVQVNFGGEIVIERSGDRWMITSPLDFPAAPGQISMLLARIASDPSASVVADNLTDSSAYGLGGEAGFASFSDADGRKIAMRIGNLTPDFNGCYIELMGEKKILQLSTNIRMLVAQSLTNWRDKRMFRFNLSEIESVDFALGDTLYHFIPSDSVWEVNGTDVPATNARDIVESLLGSTALGFIDSSVSPSTVILDYGVTLTNREHLTGQIFKSAGSEVAFGQLCLSNSADNQVYTVSSTLPAGILRGLRELQKNYLTKVSS